MPKACGTEAAAKRHRRNGEPLCEPCRLAAAAANRRHVARHRYVHGEHCATCEDVAFLKGADAPAFEIPTRVGMSREALLDHLEDHKRPGLRAYVREVEVTPASRHLW